jgi:hypothetical protein
MPPGSTVVPATPNLSLRANTLCMSRAINKSFCQRCIAGQRIGSGMVHQM